MAKKASEKQDAWTLDEAAYEFLGQVIAARDTEMYEQMLAENIAQGNTADMDAYFAKHDAKNLKKLAQCEEKYPWKTATIVPLMRIVKVAAFVFVFLSVSVSVAMAASPEFRAEAVRLLQTDQGEYTTLEIVIDPDAFADVPEGWEGSCFPSYIPEGFEVDEILSLPECCDVILSGKTSNLRVHFAEYGDSVVCNLDTENATMKEILIQGQMATMAIKEKTIHIYWLDGLHYHILSTNGLDENTAIEIAQSVRKIK